MDVRFGGFQNKRCSGRGIIVGFFLRQLFITNSEIVEKINSALTSCKYYFFPPRRDWVTERYAKLQAGLTTVLKFTEVPKNDQ